MSIEIKNLASAGDVRELTAEEMETIKGGWLATVAQAFSIAKTLDDLTGGPIDFDKMVEYAKQQASKSKQ
ncbi:MAG: hypothetical protein ACREX0_08860 [Noviherbaspirillum sp.]